MKIRKRYCPGFAFDCGDELEPIQRLCPSCQREANEYERAQQAEKEREEEQASKSQYRHLREYQRGFEAGRFYQIELNHQLMIAMEVTHEEELVNT